MDREQLQKLAGLLKEATEFDLSDNPSPVPKYKRGELTVELKVTRTVWEKGTFTIKMQDFADYFEQYGDTNKSFEQLIEDPNQTDLLNELSGYAAENDLYSGLEEYDWDDVEQYVKVLDIKTNK